MNRLDHLVYTAPSLEEGMDKIESLFGIRPIIGGQHPQWGTHNALLSLGNEYLEVIAPCPDLSVPERGLWLDSFFQQPPRIATWALQTDALEENKREALSSGIEIGRIERGQRQTADGSILSWQLTNPYALPVNGLLPFLIDWGDSKHPSETARKAGELRKLIIQHPQPAFITSALKTLNIELRIEHTEKPGLKALIETEKGLIELT